jgi:cell fate regulator YaaT (PSP1 superfamily)
MVKIIGVRFRSAGKVYYFDVKEFELHIGDHVIVETARGPEFGVVSMRARTVADDMVAQPLRSVIRVATKEDEEKRAELSAKEKEALKICREKIHKHNLEMKLVDAEYAFDENRILFYFTADGRIDFRDLVKDLASVFHTRIELRQIGVRDETRMLGGIGSCGRELCCATYLNDFAPVSIKMAKEQNLSLNPGKISGICGRLMCCLKNEEETYEFLNTRMPKLGAAATTADGRTGKVIELNVLRQRVRVLFEEDDSKEIENFSVDELTFTPRKRREEGQQGSLESGQRKPDSRSDSAQGRGESPADSVRVRNESRADDGRRKPEDAQRETESLTGAVTLTPAPDSEAGMQQQERTEKSEADAQMETAVRTDRMQRPEKGYRKSGRRELSNRPDREDRKQDASNQPGRGDRSEEVQNRQRRPERGENEGRKRRPERGEGVQSRPSRPERGEDVQGRMRRPERGEGVQSRPSRPERGEDVQGRPRRPERGENGQRRPSRPERGGDAQGRPRRPERGEDVQGRMRRPERGEDVQDRPRRPERGEEAQNRQRRGYKYKGDSQNRFRRERQPESDRSVEKPVSPGGTPDAGAGAVRERADTMEVRPVPGGENLMAADGEATQKRSNEMAIYGRR